MKIKTKLQPEKKRVVTSFEIGELKEPWDAWCKAHGNVSSGDALCQVIQKLTGADPSKMPAAKKRAGEGAKPTKPERPYRQLDKAEPKLRSRLEVQLKASERAAVEARAKADGFEHATKWVVALIRTRLTNHPQFGTNEIEILGQSNHQLLAIGRNLNQIAHKLNAAKGQSVDAYEAEMVGDLARAVKKHVQNVGDALRASIYRWSLD